MFAENFGAWYSREIAFISLFFALKMADSRKQSVHSKSSDVKFLWEMIAAAVSEESVFSATLVSQILKHHWKAMHKAYGKQMEKMIHLIELVVLPNWRSSLQELETDDPETRAVVRTVAENALTSLEFTVDECLSSFNNENCAI
ncbi:unnamed protein product [Thelazia callipaeda]|uniref:GLE1 RNA export mediator n=1 Tax=Thelazia callipaeda TaxID=103827 RepID=A0A0N5D9K3_THECL|nr:unnamed protein product [Thelazia callipaeda]